ncbi:hypothetical protein [Yinghuangia sp. YIM S09857]|uniref:hypothetical protein n=1 Tax=Yinghuangia sp. YIM S09857 TaxID=3436929 RepID=UPI003F534AC1
MSADTNGDGRGRDHPGSAEPAPWTIRPGTPLDDTGEQHQDPYGATQSGPAGTGGGRPGRAGGRAAARRARSGRGTPDTSAATPDWSALADREARRRQRARTFKLRIGAALTVLAAVGVTAAWLTASSDDDSGPAAQTAPTQGAENPADSGGAKPTFRPAPTVPPAPGSKAVLADPQLDTGPFTPEALFPTARLGVDGRVYNVVAKRLDTTCADAGNPVLGGILRGKGCVQLIRATVTGPDGTAATVAVAAFNSADDARSAAAEGNGNREASLLGLPGGAVKELCPQSTPEKPGVTCIRQTNSVGRYGLFLVGGYPGADNRIDPAKGDPKVEQTGDDLDQIVRDALTQRGEERSQAIYDQAKAEAEKALEGK